MPRKKIKKSRRVNTYIKPKTIRQEVKFPYSRYRIDWIDIITDYEPLLNAKVVEGESIEALPDEVKEVSSSSSHKKKEKQNAPKSE